MFDFDKYHKNMTVTSDALIDISNIPIKHDSSASAIDENGKPYDVVLNEHVSKNIDYVVTEVNVNSAYYSGSKYDKREGHTIKDVNITTQVDGKSVKSDAQYSFRKWSPLDDANYDVIDPSGNRVSQATVSGNFDNPNNTSTSFSGTISVQPKHELLTRTLPIADNDNEYAHILAMFGLLGPGCETLKWATDKDRYKTKNCVMSAKTLSKRLKKAKSRIIDPKFEIETTTYYDLHDPDDDSDTPAEVSLPSSKILYQFNMPPKGVVSADTSGFCTQMKKYGYMINCDGNESTPYLPSIRDAFEAYYYPKEDLADDFTENFNEVIYRIKKLWRFKDKLKKSTVKKINKVCAKDYRYANSSELNYIINEENEAQEWLVDFQSCLYINKNDNPNYPLPYARLVSPIYGANSAIRCVTERVTNGLEVLYKFTPEVFRVKNVSPNNALLNYTEMSLPEVFDYLKTLYDDHIVPTYSSASAVPIGRNQWLVEALNVAYDSYIVPLVWSDSSYTQTFKLCLYGNTDDQIEEYLNGEQFDDIKIKVLTWTTEVEFDKDTGACTKKKEPVAELMQDSSSAESNIHDKIAIIDDIDDILSRFNIAIAAVSMLSPTTGIMLKLLMHNLEKAVDDFNIAVKRIKYFEYYAYDSVFDSKEMILRRRDCYKASSSTNPPKLLTLPARFLVPTKMYVKKKFTKKIFGIKRKYTKRVCVGIRWTEIRFINVGLYDRYPKNNDVPMAKLPFISKITIKGSSGKTVDEIPTSVSNGEDVILALSKGTKLDCTVVDRYTLTISSKINAGTYDTSYILKGLDSTKPSDNRDKVKVYYKMPHLPYDNEIRTFALAEYGPFDQSVNAEIKRGTSQYNAHDGWKIFFDSSNQISSLRQGINIYPSVAHLIRILKDTFGSNRVQLCDATRSQDDQAKICLGGEESAFLSWHNYGLAVKILIYNPDCKTTIEPEGPDMVKLIDIAEQFTNNVKNGMYGAYFNVVWCGRLKTGANIFDWEFLPIGIEHKDAYKFRDSTIMQRDPIQELAYVSANRYATTQTTSSSKGPWISKANPAYANAEVINGQHFVPPKAIRNYPIAKNLVLINVIEYLKLIRLKMFAYGTKLPDSDDLYSWLCKNRQSYNQLLVYFGLLGNLQSFKSLLSGEYTLRYKPVLENYYNTDAIEFVKHFLGKYYNEAKIVINNINDASYISLKDGRLHIPCADGRPNLPLSADNLFDQQQVTIDNYQRGVWKDGRFIPATPDMEYVSKNAVISGYSNNNAVGGDAYLLHSIVADQIKAELEKITKQFENYNGLLMFDSFKNGPNADKFDQLENEFGIIASQDLISFDKLRSMLISETINDNAGISSTGTILGIDRENNTIYEKVISNAEVAGMRLASLSSEHIEINERKDEGLTLDDLNKIIQNGNAPTANELMK